MLVAVATGVNRNQVNKGHFSQNSHLGRHVMCDAELQVCEDALHAVERLLTGGPQVFLHGPGHRSEDGLSRLPRVHHFSRVFGGRGDLVLVETLDVCEGLFHRHDQPREMAKKRHIVVVGFVVISEQNVLSGCLGQISVILFSLLVRNPSLTWPCVCGPCGPSQPPRSNTRCGSCLSSWQRLRSWPWTDPWSCWWCSLQNNTRRERS